MKNIIYTILAFFLLSVSCTSDFEELNKDPNEVTNESLKQDFNDMGSYFPTLLGNIIRPTGGEQVDHNLANDAFVRHMATPTNFINNRNNTTYYITWNTYWGHVYSNVMAPASQVIELAQENENVMFENWAKLIRVIVAGRLTTFQGPIIYSKYGSKDATIDYDSEEDLYKALFKDLDGIHTIFNKNKTKADFVKFDVSYGGSIPKWIKLINSLRLRFAMRLAKANPTLAKAEAEKALSDAGGLIETNADNFYISLYGREMPESIISFSWNDTRMSATMESVLVGYKDPRISKFFEPATVDKSKYPNPYADANYPYKGIMASSHLKNKDLRIPYSTVTKNFRTAKKRIVLSAAEVLFLKAEAALRNWAGAGDAKTNYENAVKASFEQWGASGADTYLQNSSDLPINYVDVVAPADDKLDTNAPHKSYNNFTNRITVKVKWDGRYSKEKKLEQIITQKWIAFYTNSVEAWVDHRRTGYPKLPFNKRNDSNEDFGVIKANDFIRRMPFVPDEINNNPDGVKKAVDKLKGGHGANGGIDAKLYFDTDNLGKSTPVNF